MKKNNNYYIINSGKGEFMNNKGFTLIEVLAAFMLLGILVTFTAVSVIDYLDSADEAALKAMKENIKSGMINYYNECKYLSSDAICKKDGAGSVIDDNGELKTTIGDLAAKGFLERNGFTSIVDPVDNTDISSCEVSIKYENQEFALSFKSDNCGNLS